MYYLIDGYNLIFSMPESKDSLQTLREKVVNALKKKFIQKDISGTLVFDGAHRREEESGLSYPSPLIVAYAPKGQSADDYIVELLSVEDNPKEFTVITNDKGLIRHAKSYGAKSQSNKEFINWLQKKKKNEEKNQVADSKRNIDRLIKVFEERFKNPERDP